MVSSTPRPHFTPVKDPVPILQEAGWTPGPVWTGGKSRPHRHSIPDCPAHSQSLYRLSYPAHIKGECTRTKYKIKDTLVHAMKSFVGVEVQRHLFLPSTLYAVCFNFTSSPLSHLCSLNRKLHEVHSQCGPPEKFWDCTSNYENTVTSILFTILCS